MVFLRGNMAGAFMVTVRAFVVHFHSGHTHRGTVLQIRVPGLLSLWKAHPLRRRFRIHYRKYHLADSQRHPSGGQRSTERTSALCDDHRHPIWAAVLQVCKIGALAFWGGGLLSSYLVGIVTVHRSSSCSDALSFFSIYDFSVLHSLYKCQ